MTDEEHLVENIIEYVRQNWSEKDSLPKGLMENGNAKVSKETLKWLNEMAQYVIYEENLQTSAYEEDINELQKENAELKARISNIFNYLANEIPHELINEATNKIWKMI